MSNLAKQWAAALLATAAGKPKEELDQLVNNFFNTLKKENKIYLAKSIIHRLEKLTHQKKAARGVTIQAARELPQNLIEQIAKIFKTTASDVTVAIDPKILGGVAIRQKDFLYDLSVKKQIETLKTILTR